MPELVLNHVVTFHDLIKELGLDELVAPLNSLLILKQKAYAALLSNKRNKESEEKKNWSQRLPY